MKKRSTTYITIGSVLIILNLLADLADLRYLVSKLFEYNSFNIGYVIGSQFLLICGLILFTKGYRMRKRIKEHEENQKTVDEFAKQLERE